MQQAIRKNPPRPRQGLFMTCKRHLALFGTLTGELIALASLTAALAAALITLKLMLAA
ncbi:MAG: hypothetical protein JJU31_14395 [Wenzhouxiangella sp.]|nr:hypothetical protein [Wenzhouxiangella sp.]MCH8476828.1 hypothetical protein [Wenzhouxiangella sp.]